MSRRLIQYSAVVVGQAHNPTILNPDFLASENIVPREWDWRVAETITTPALAFVRYENGVSLTVEQNKLQVVDPNVQQGIGDSKAGAIAAAYVQTLRHVRYTATGNNFQSLVDIGSPDEYLKNRFLKDGPWKAIRPLAATGIRLIYPLDEVGRLTVAVDTGEAKLAANAQPSPVIIVNANFSRTCSSHPAVDEVGEHLNSAPRDYSAYEELLRELVAIEESA